MGKLVPCRECKHEVSPSAATCPNCGVKNPAKKGGIGAGGLIAVVIVGWFAYTVMGPAMDSSTRAPSAVGTPTGTDAARARANQRYVHQTVNVRAGPGTDHAVVRQLERGDLVIVRTTENDWARIDEGEWASLSLLKDHPIPPIEVASWNWRSDRDFGTSGAVIWNVELRNNTNRYIKQVRVEFTSYDAQGNLITTDFGYVQGLAPGSTSATKGYATYFGREDRARIQVKN